MTDVEKVAEVLASHYGHVRINTTYVWPHPSQRVLDCVLSLNRRYNAVVKPRLEAFSSKHPQVRSLVELKELMAHYESLTLSVLWS